MSLAIITGWKCEIPFSLQGMDLQCNKHHSCHNTYKKTVLVLALLALLALLVLVEMKVEKTLEQVRYYLDIK